MITNFDKHKKTINIYIQNDYNKNEIIKKFPSCCL